jgi:hypothetical protein
MKKTMLFAAALLLPLWAQAAGAPPAAGAADAASPAGAFHGMTLEEARKAAHEKADRLDRMTPEEWAHHEQRRRELFERVSKMTPQQREKFFESRRKYYDAWKNMPPEQRDAAKAKWKNKAADGAPAPDAGR